MPNLSKRLKLISSLVPIGARVCDIGTDHGYLSIELSKTASKVIAADINEKPLETAKKNALKYGVSDIEFRLCDGLSAIKKEEVDTVIIAGIGGEVISGIIERGMNIAANKDITLILQPTTSPEFLRRFLLNNGFQIEKDIPISENGKIYSVIVVKYNGDTVLCSNTFYFIGKVSPLTFDGLAYIKKQYNRCLKNANAMKSIPEKQKEFEYYNGICKDIEKLLER